jgi:ribosomal protein S18 acetylase RimI-like enzyme
MRIVRLEKGMEQYYGSLSKVRELNIIPEKIDIFLDNQLNIAYMVLDQDEVVGFSWGYIQERIDNENMLYIHSVDVIESHRNKGVGTLMIQTFLDFAKNNNFRNTFLITDDDNFEANKLYSKFTDEIEKDKILYIFK